MEKDFRASAFSSLVASHYSEQLLLENPVFCRYGDAEALYTMRTVIRPRSVFLIPSIISPDLNKEHKNALQQFLRETEKDVRGGIRLVGYVTETYCVLGEDFVKNLLMCCSSVGIVVGRRADGRLSSGTVFRVGSCYVMTNKHVVEGLLGEWGRLRYLL